jgi:hypothetical protein
MTPARYLLASSAIVACVACGPPAHPSVETSDTGGESTSTSTSTGDLPAAEWMSGAYSSWLLTPHRYEVGIGFNGDSVRYYFHEGGAFEEVQLTSGDTVLRTTQRDWEPLSATRARVSRVPEDYDSLKWIDLDFVVPAEGCPYVSLTFVDDEPEPAGGPTVWPGEVCVVAEDEEPVEDPGPTYHLEWCGEPPPGCAVDGCPCSE